MVTRSEPDYAWDFCGGQLAVDFTNTVGSRGGTAEDHLNVFGDLLSWAETRGVIARSAAQRLRREADRRPAIAKDALGEAVALREALYRVLSAAASGRTPPAADLATFNAHVEMSFSGARLQRASDRFELTFAPDRVARQQVNSGADDWLENRCSQAGPIGRRERQLEAIAGALQARA